MGNFTININNAKTREKAFNRMNRSFDIIMKRRELKHDPPSLKRWFKRQSLNIEYQFLDYYFGGPPKWRISLRSLNKSKRILPDFAVVSPMKSGSSDLSTYLLQHPAILKQLCKEIPVFHDSDIWRIFYPTVDEKIETEKRFGTSRCGFFAPFIAQSAALSETLSNIHNNFKIVLLLRDPVKRAYSQWKWDILGGGVRAKNMKIYQRFSNYAEQAVDSFPDSIMSSICGASMLHEGIYYKYVNLWIEKFGVDNVLVINACDFFKETERTLMEIYGFLGLPEYRPLITDKIYNRNRIKTAPLDEDAKYILSEFYKPYNQKLYNLIGKTYNWI